MIKLTQLNYQYDNLTMLFDFSVKSGECVAIMKFDGAGKSTLLSLISGFQFAKTGAIELNGENHTFTPLQNALFPCYFKKIIYLHI